MMELTTENMAKLAEWQNIGVRSVQIKMDNVRKQVWEDYEPITIWCFDYEIEAGLFITEIEELPTIEDLKALKTQKLKEEIQRLEPFELPRRQAV